jgi:hypothetical protein
MAGIGSIKSAVIKASCQELLSGMRLGIADLRVKNPPPDELAVGYILDVLEERTTRCGEVVWGSPQYDHEDAEFFRSARIPSAGTAASKKLGPYLAWIDVAIFPLGDGTV